MAMWHPPLHPMQHPLFHLAAHSDLDVRDEGTAYLESARAQLAGDQASDASGALDAAFEDFEEIQNRNSENWHRGPSVDVVDVADDLAETFYLKGRVAEKAEKNDAGRPDLGWADDFYRRAAEQATRKTNYYQDEWGAFRARTAR
jgi:hypothetical protein